MARTMSKRTTSTAKKPTVKKVETAEIIEETSEVIEDVKPKTVKKIETKSVEAKVEAKEYQATDVIECKSIFNGEMLYVGKKSNNLYRWSNYGDVELVEYQDIAYELKSAGDKSIAMIPRFIILDDALVSQFPRLISVYNKLYSVNDLKEIILLPSNEMATVMKQLPAPVKDTIKGLAATMIDNGELDSISAVETIDKVLGTSLSLTLSHR